MLLIHRIICVQIIHYLWSVRKQNDDAKVKKNIKHFIQNLGKNT